ncbi:hypothetical protein LCGC14_1957550 [marine sediment metagenome]|uniref:Uncharacterized protein n=1 Tax=marine sediment metagenome TaxID=412755 RepID=A0A0F9FFI2_9ZZZZ
MDWPIPISKYNCYYCKNSLTSVEFFEAKERWNYDGRVFCSTECRDAWIEQEYDDGRYGSEPMEDFI